MRSGLTPIRAASVPGGRLRLTGKSVDGPWRQLVVSMVRPQAAGVGVGEGVTVNVGDGVNRVGLFVGMAVLAGGSVGVEGSEVEMESVLVGAGGLQAARSRIMQKRTEVRSSRMAGIYSFCRHSRGTQPCRPPALAHQAQPLT